jgi:DNA-binding GntR family transcriptional regulator
MIFFNEIPNIKFDKNDAKSLRENISKMLEEAIYSGYLPPGSRIIESQIANKLEISRTPVREAILQLESEGLVKTITNKGAFVSIYSIDEIDEIYIIFGALSGVAASISLEAIDESGLKQMETCIAKMEVSKNNINRREWFMQNNDFHRAFIKPCKKKVLLKLIKNYTKQVGRYWYLMLSYPGSIELFHREHKDILEAFKLKKPKMVRELVESHVRSFGKIVIESLRSISPSELEYPTFTR